VREAQVETNTPAKNRLSNSWGEFAR